MLDEGCEGRAICMRLWLLTGLDSGECGPGRERGIDEDRECGRCIFGEQTEHESSEQLLNELLDRELHICFGGGDGGLLERGKIFPRLF